jgi:SPX domain protein involved in polyphosphate accumulation
MFHYIDYDGLKDALRTHKAWDEAAEQAFVAKLETELDKVYSFTRVKSEEIIRRISASEKEVSDVVARLDGNEGPSQQDPPSEDDFELLEEDLSDIIADVHDLAKFAQLNYTGFQKIIKKHDVSAVPAWCMPAHWAPR